MLCLVCQQKGTPLPNGRPSQNYGVVAMSITLEPNAGCNLNEVLANHRKEEKIFPLTAQEIAEAQKANDNHKHGFKCNAVLDKGLEVSLVDNTHMVCKESRAWCTFGSIKNL
jgi:hypothetical protein